MGFAHTAVMVPWSRRTVPRHAAPALDLVQNLVQNLARHIVQNAKTRQTLIGQCSIKGENLCLAPGWRAIATTTVMGLRSQRNVPRLAAPAGETRMKDLVLLPHRLPNRLPHRLSVQRLRNGLRCTVASVACTACP